MAPQHHIGASLWPQESGSLVFVSLFEACLVCCPVSGGCQMGFRSEISGSLLTEPRAAFRDSQVLNIAFFLSTNYMRLNSPATQNRDTEVMIFFKYAKMYLNKF